MNLYAAYAGVNGVDPWGCDDIDLPSSMADELRFTTGLPLFAPNELSTDPGTPDFVERFLARREGRIEALLLAQEHDVRILGIIPFDDGVQDCALVLLALGDILPSNRFAEGATGVASGSLDRLGGWERAGKIALATGETAAWAIVPLAEGRYASNSFRMELGPLRGTSCQVNLKAPWDETGSIASFRGGPPHRSS
ncbi:MAG: hypothetical protein A3K19_02935 [Lentisphaerae bacterium RIFOXYB12_FULL_65_16]|nr:MAG: hypothetical protein A3K18_19985 [Lentisphaerae bacterium RIFOXYA12_64_32]OGV92307.1 MAG: hypothetical protein A3K19_02935 [Lentisphaerae bacterium RIFOXYB12_FULL_65_16]